MPGLFGVSHGAVQFAVYEHLKAQFNAWRGAVPEAKLVGPAMLQSISLALALLGQCLLQRTEEYLLTAALSKAAAVTVTYPYQVVRSRLQV